jgi:hypothetical protein
MAKRIRVFGSIEKVEAQDDGTLKVSGIASSETVDGAGEVVKADAMRAAIPDYMKFGAVREMHANIAAGTALAIDVDDDGVTHFEAHVVDPVSCKKVETGVLKGFSIGGKVSSRDPLNKKIITGLSLTEISLVDVPCNPDAVFAMAKFETPEEDEVDQETSTTETQTTSQEAETTSQEAETVKKGLWTVQDFAGILQQIGWIAQDCQFESEAEGDASPVPAKLREWVAAGATIFQEMAAEEVAELLASLTPKGTPAVEVITAAAGTDGLEKAGAKFSKATKDSLDAAHKDLEEVHKSMGDYMGKLAAIWKDGGGDDVAASQASEAISKAAGLQDELAKVQVEKEALQKSLDAISTDLKSTKDALAKAEADLKTKGAKQAVPVEKGKESTTLGAADQPTTSTDPLDVMKAVQGQPVSLIYNPR